MYSTSSIIPFGPGKSYVVRGNEPQERVEYRFTDNLGRTQQDRDFLDQYERIFLAASEGELKECQEIVEKEGFRDFGAESHWRFGTGSGKYLNGISVMKIAEMRGHLHVLSYFKKINEESQKKSVDQKFPEGKNISNSNQPLESEEKTSRLFGQTFSKKQSGQKSFGVGLLEYRQSVSVRPIHL